MKNYNILVEENYMLVFSDKKVSVCYKGAPLRDGEEIITLAAPYEEYELRLIKFTQSADDMFLVHPNHPPYVLSRYGHTDWRIQEMDIKGGPFENMNTTETMISASGVTGDNITLTATEDYFTNDMKGMLIRLGHTVESQHKKGVPFQQIIIERDEETGTEKQVTIPADDLEVSCVPGASVYVESFGFWKGNFSLEKYVDGSWTKIRTQDGNHSQNYTFSETNNEESIV